mgnify:CR=1 FL=1
MRILGLDFGTKTTGVAVSDPMGWTAQGLEIIRRQEDEHLKATLNRIALTGHYDLDTIEYKEYASNYESDQVNINIITILLFFCKDTQ